MSVNTCAQPLADSPKSLVVSCVLVDLLQAAGASKPSSCHQQARLFPPTARGPALRPPRLWYNFRWKSSLFKTPINLKAACRTEESETNGVRGALSFRGLTQSPASMRRASCSQTFLCLMMKCRREAALHPCWYFLLPGLFSQQQGYYSPLGLLWGNRNCDVLNFALFYIKSKQRCIIS